MTDLELVLTALSDELAIPRAPSVRADVLARIETRRRARSFRLRVAACVAALLALSAGSVFAAVPAAREGLLDILRLGDRVTVERVETLPPVPGTVTLRPGRPVTLEEAERAVGFALLVPEALGSPDAVFLSKFLPDGEVNFVYRPRPRITAVAADVGVLVSQFGRAGHGAGIVRKLVDEAGAAERLRVAGYEALWVTGPHVFLFRRSDSAVAQEMRLAANALILLRDDSYVRIESALPRARVVRIAESLASP